MERPGVQEVGAKHKNLELVSPKVVFGTKAVFKRF